MIDNIVLTSKVVKEDLTEGAIDSKDFTVTADNENSDGKITNAFDNNISTIWHTQWSPNKKPPVSYTHLKCQSISRLFCC